MNKQQALKKLDEIFDPAIARCKQETESAPTQKTKKIKVKK